MHEGELGIMIPIIAVTLGLAIPMVKAVVDYKRALIDAMNRERMAAIEKGITPPAWPDHLVRDKGEEELPTTSEGREIARHRQLTTGLVILFVGIAILFGLPPLIGDSTARTGLIPIGIGVALLIAWAVRRRSGGGSANSGTP
jgi:hypothetical protein